MAGKHAADNPNRPAKQVDVPAKVKKELGKAVKKAIDTKKDGKKR